MTALAEVRRKPLTIAELLAFLGLNDDSARAATQALSVERTAVPTSE